MYRPAHPGPPPGPPRAATRAMPRPLPGPPPVRLGAAARVAFRIQAPEQRVELLRNPRAQRQACLLSQFRPSDMEYVEPLFQAGANVTKR